MIHSFLAVFCLLPLGQASDASPQEVFQKRLLPIFASPNPSSCVQCHLADVDLKTYIRPTHEQTFAALRDQGLIDLEKPEKSKILELIRRGEKDPGASLIHQKNREAELAAFADWIQKSVRDPAAKALPKAQESVGPAVPAAIVRHGRKDRLLETYQNTIWAMRFRCMSCHIEGTAENKKLVEKHGSRVAWFKASGSAESLEYLLNNRRLIDLDEPEKSLLLLKPLNEEKHGGGKKFNRGDQGYRDFLAFLQDYARLKKNGYTDPSQLPAFGKEPRKFGTDIWIKIANTLPDWGDHLLQVDLYAWDAKAKAWETEPIASTDRMVWGKGKQWQHNLTLSAPADSERAQAWKKGPVQLAAGKYLVKVFVDREDRRGMSKTWPSSDYAGQAEIQSSWPSGYGKMTVVEGAKVRK